jgi:hypothetical protein
MEEAMNRRTILAAPAAFAAAAVAPDAGAAPPPASEPWSHAAIRERVALVVATFTRATGGFPEPMTPEEAAAALAFTDEDIAEPIGGPLPPFAWRWGVSLDWLLLGDMGALLGYARAGFSAGREQDGAS